MAEQYRGLSILTPLVNPRKRKERAASPEPSPRASSGLICLTPDLGEDQHTRGLPDIVAIHGINGDARRSWTHENGACWLRDFLPDQIPGARVFSFGYDAQVALTTSKGELDDFARSLLNCLKIYRGVKVGQGC